MLRDGDRRKQEELLFRSVREFWGTPESVDHYTERSRTDRLAPPERALVERYMLPPATVLDIGCGTGREAFELVEMGFAVTGVDVAPGMVQRAKELAQELALDVDFRLADGRRLDFPDGSFDYVLLITQMIHSVPLRANRIGLLREAGRVLKPSGGILLTYNDQGIEKRCHGERGVEEEPPDPRAEDLAKRFDILEPGDGFGNICQGQPTKVYGYLHRFTAAEMEGEVRRSDLQIVDRGSFLDIGGGGPNEPWRRFWFNTRFLVLKRP